jgi:hypothetical protein
MTPSTATKDRLFAEIARHRSPTRAVSRRRALIAYSMGALACLAVFQAAGGIDHSEGRPLHFTLFIAGGIAVLAVLASRGTLFRSLAMASRPTSLAWMLCGIVPLITLLWLGAWHGYYVEPFHRVGYRCVALGSATGAILLGVTLYLQRNTMPRSPWVMGAALGAASAAWAAIFVVLWCPLTNAPHVCVGHVFPIFLITLLGALVGSKVLAIRSR